MEFHPNSNIFPLLDAVALAALTNDIGERKQLQPIVTYQEKILDGRNRYLACKVLGIEPDLEEYTGTDPLGHVVALNLHRRHLTVSQRAMIGARLAKLPQGARTDLSPKGERSQADVAEALEIGKRSVERAGVVLEFGAPELHAAIDRGDIAVTLGARLARLPFAEQCRAIARADKRAVRKIYRANNKATKAARRAELAAKNNAIATNSSALPTGRLHTVTLADPPWPEGAEGHYPTMTVEQICALPVADLATPDAILYLWVTSPMLERSFEVIKAWGFTYKSSISWDKIEWGRGTHVQNQHELLLIATRGEALVPIKCSPSVIRELKREHSRKPEAAYALIERAHPDLSRIELFARNARPGWTSWGNEIGNAEEQTAA
jgi:N6-adenosine-specific RNA methylase IME4/ParB-like chromosome segregation protein Spo0J